MITNGTIGSKDRRSTIEPSLVSAMDELTRQVAQMALRLSALPAEATRNDMQSLEVIEQLALRILKEVSVRRVCASGNAPNGGINGGVNGGFDARETRGSWCIRT